MKIGYDCILLWLKSVNYYIRLASSFNNFQMELEDVRQPIVCVKGMVTSHCIQNLQKVNILVLFFISKSPQNRFLKKYICKFENFIKNFLFTSFTKNLYPLPTGDPRHDYQRNMGAELPVFRIWQSKLCARKTDPIWGDVLYAHGFECQIPNNGRSAPILHRQAGILLYNWRTYQPVVCNYKKNDAKPISGSLDQCHNLALILETPEIGEASVYFGSNAHA